MQNIFINHNDIVWALIILLAWLIGEMGHQLTKIPRISFYMIIGFLFSSHQFGILPIISNTEIGFLINVATSLILFEFGYRINLNWLKNHPSILITGLCESLATFLLVFTLAKMLNISTIMALEFATLAIATSPVIIMYMINQRQSSGPVTERVLHLTAINCIIAIFSFKFIFGLIVFKTSGNLVSSAWAGLLMLIFSILLGLVFITLVVILTRLIKSLNNNITITIASFAIFITMLAQVTGLSPIVAILTFSIAARHFDIAMGKAQRNFGALGELLVVVLFVAMPIGLDWHNIWLGVLIPVILFTARLIIKTTVVSIFSHYSGMPWSKSIYSGLALTPTGIFSILMVDQNNYAGVHIGNELATLTFVILILEIIGPIIINYSLTKAKETS